MNTVHIYPGLRYKPKTMDPQILLDHNVQETLGAASKILKKDVSAMLQQERPDYFNNTPECFVVNFAATLAVGQYYVKRNGNADIILGRSLGHYAGLVMAESLDMKEVLDVLKLNGQRMDDYFYNLKVATLLVEKSTPMLTINNIALGTGQAFLLADDIDGHTITGPRQLLHLIRGAVDTLGGKSQMVLVRPPYHTPGMEDVEKLTWPNIDTLNVKPPQTRFMSTCSASFLSLQNMIRDVLKIEMSTPLYYEECMARIDQEIPTRRVAMLMDRSEEI